MTNEPLIPQSNPPPTGAASAPAGTSMAAPPRAGWQRAKFILKAVEVRMRFIAVLVGLGLAIAYWSTIQNYWDHWTRPTSVAAADSDTEYFCPMHPQVVRASLDPGGKLPNCPICGMPLSKRKKGEKPTLPEGVLARVQLSPQRVTMAGVQTVTVDYRPLASEIRTVGYVDYDESKLSKIVTRVSGFIEKLYVDKTYSTVEAGQPLAEIYSPELYSSVQELLIAKKYNDQAMLASGRERLRLLGVNDKEIDQFLSDTQARPRIMIRAPRSGHIIGKNVVQGAAVEPGMTIFEVADLSTVWIEAEVYEKDLALLRIGQQVEATVDALPDEVFRGQVALVHPHLETATRTNRLRLVLENPDHKLRPGMFATVTIRTQLEEMEPFRTVIEASRRGPAGSDDASLIAYQKNCPVTGRALGSMGPPVKVTVDSRTVFLCCQGCEEPIKAEPAKYLAKLAQPADGVLAVPESAVIDTGTKKIVYIEREPGVFEGVEVKLGPRSGEFYAVIEGLAAGDRVAASGAFLIDAETRLNPAAAATYFGASGSGGAGSATTTSGATAGLPGATAGLPSSATTPLTEKELENIQKLPPADRDAAIKQAVCPVSGDHLGSMGPPEKIELDGHAVFLCCDGCRSDAIEKKDEVLKKLGLKP